MGAITRWQLGGWLLLLCSCAGAGDRKPVFPVKGQVLVNGLPAASVSVVFHPDNHDPKMIPAQAVTSQDGTFSLSTYQAGDGAPAGEYRVTFIWSKARTDDEDGGFDLFRGKYGNPNASAIRINIKPEANELEPFRLAK